MGNNWINLLIILLAFGGPALSWIVQQLREKAEQKRMRLELQRRRDEELRTGRSAGDEDLPKLQSKAEDRASELQRLAERRQQQLRELRARQAQKQTGGTQTAPVPLPANRRGPAAGQRSSGAPAQGRAVPGPVKRRESRTAQRSSSQQSPPIVDRTPTQTPMVPDTINIQQAMRESAPAALDQASIAQQLQQLKSDGAAPKPAERSVHSRERRESPALGREVHSLLRGARTRDPSKPSLAALYAVSEVLAPPVALRDQKGDGGVIL